MSDIEALPAGWAEIKLGDAIPYGETDKAEPTEIASDAWVIELEDIEKSTSRLLRRVLFSERQSKSTKNIFAKGDVLYGKLRPYLNKVLIADRDGYSTTEIVPLKSNPAVHNRFLYHWLRHPKFLEYVAAESHGINMPRLGTDAGRNAPFILAPLAEQKRIADKLDALLARVDACRERLDRVPQILKRFRQSVLAAAVEGRLTWTGAGSMELQDVEFEDDVVQVPKSWTSSTLEDVINPKRPLCYGVVQPGESVADGVHMIRVQDLDRSVIRTDQLRTISHDIDREYRRSRVVEGDLLLSVVGTIGRTAIVPAGFEGNIARALARIACNETVDAKWINIWLSCTKLQWWLLRSAREVARKTLNLSELGATKIALPSLTEQHEIVRRVEALFAIADRLEARLAAAQARAETLTPALLAKAFRGELVPQDPNDEPASKLLARVQASQTAAAENTNQSLPRRG